LALFFSVTAHDATTHRGKSFFDRKFAGKLLARLRCSGDCFLLLLLLTGVILFAVGINNSDFRGFFPQNGTEQLHELEQPLEQISKSNEFNALENPNADNRSETLPPNGK
jgi:hypothetical protein